MGLLDNKTQQEYYEGGKYGNYQFVTMNNIIAAFMVAYVGEDKLISKVSKTDVQFHAMRAIQELSYDVFRSIKSQEIEVPVTLKMILPHDYVNYVKIAKVDNSGIERVLYPTGKTSNPFAIKQTANGTYDFDTGVNVGTGAYNEDGSEITTDVIIEKYYTKDFAYFDQEKTIIKTAAGQTLFTGKTKALIKYLQVFFLYNKILSSFLK